MNEKSKTIKTIALITAIVLLFAGVISALVIALRNSNDNIGQNPTDSDVVQTENPVNFMALSLNEGFAVAAADNGQKTVTKKITATVLPTDAPDKSVDWAVTWCVPIDGENISDYLTVTPDSDGALTATITAYKGFENASAYVTATTRVGGYTASCIVVYEGAPESLTFVYNGSEISSSGSLTLTAGTTNQISLNLKNTLGAVGSKYGDYEITKIQGQGRFTMTKEYIVNGSVSSSEDIVFNLEEGSYSYTHEVSKDTQTLTITPDQFLTASVSDDVLTVKAIKSVSSYSNGYPRTGYRFTYKGTYTDPRSGGVADTCRWYILVKEKVSGKEALIHINIESTVSSVSLSDSILYI